MFDTEASDRNTEQKSQRRISRFGIMVVATALCLTTAYLAKAARVADLQEASVPTAKSSLDFQFYRNQVEPIFLKKRGDHARCYACHSQNTSAFRLQRLQVERTSFTEEQSRLNFES